jgi:hypothetical protein
MSPVAGPKVILAMEANQGVIMAIHGEENIAAPAPIAAIRSAAWNVLFSSKTDHSIATIATADEDLCLIVKHDPNSTRRL